MNSSLPYWLAALHWPTIGPRIFLRWLKHFKNIKELFAARDAELLSIGMTSQQLDYLKTPDWFAVEGDLAWATTINHHLIALDDERYPTLLKEINDPPLVLFVKGEVSFLNEIQLAVVGARNATVMGLENTTQFSQCLAQAGFTITSGLALGIDGAAHRGALKVKGKTIAVLGTGLQHIYPKTHMRLAEEISENGAVVSEFPLTMLPIASNFPRRNRIIAGLSMGVLVVEAALRSGSLITAKYALDQGREVFAIPGSIHNPLARGCHYLIQQGAKLVETAGDIVGELKAHAQLTAEPSQFMLNQGDQVGLNLYPEKGTLIEHVGHEITPLDVIILRSGLTSAEVSSMLLTLELDGYVQSVPGGYVRASRR